MTVPVRGGTAFWGRAKDGCCVRLAWAAWPDYAAYHDHEMGPARSPTIAASSKKLWPGGIFFFFFPQGGFFFFSGICPGLHPFLRNREQFPRGPIFGHSTSRTLAGRGRG